MLPAEQWHVFFDGVRSGASLASPRAFPLPLPPAASALIAPQSVGTAQMALGVTLTLEMWVRTASEASWGAARDASPREDDDSDDMWSGISASGSRASLDATAPQVVATLAVVGGDDVVAAPGGSSTVALTLTPHLHTLRRLRTATNASYFPRIEGFGVAFGSADVAERRNDSELQTTALGGRARATHALRVADAAWHHVALVVNEGRARLYVDGAPGSDVWVWRTAAAGTGFLNLTLGRDVRWDASHDAASAADLEDGAGRRPFHGLMREVRLWSTARSENQLLAAMHRPLLDTAAAALNAGSSAATMAFDATGAGGNARASGSGVASSSSASLEGLLAVWPLDGAPSGAVRIAGQGALPAARWNRTANVLAVDDGLIAGGMGGVLSSGAAASSGFALNVSGGGAGGIAWVQRYTNRSLRWHGSTSAARRPFVSPHFANVTSLTLTCDTTARCVPPLYMFVPFNQAHSPLPSSPPPVSSLATQQRVARCARVRRAGTMRRTSSPPGASARTAHRRLLGTTASRTPSCAARAGSTTRLPTKSGADGGTADASGRSTRTARR